MTGMALVNSCCPCNEGWLSGLFLLWFVTLEIQGMPNPIFHVLLEEMATSQRTSEDTVYISNCRKEFYLDLSNCVNREEEKILVPRTGPRRSLYVCHEGTVMCL